MTIEELLSQVEATVVTEEMASNMFARLKISRKEFEKSVREKTGDSEFLTQYCDI